MKKTNKAFTLAEVLIALTIIGVIAAITVPALVQRTNKQEYVTALQKTYSTLSQAANRIIAEEGSPKGDDSWILTNGNSKNVYETFKKHLNVIKDCGGSSGCFSQASNSLKWLNGSNVGGTNWDGAKGAYNRVILNDGTQILFANTDKTCSLSGRGSNNHCISIIADINGEKKPNTIGRDIFAFVIKEDGLYPAGCDYNACNPNFAGGSLAQNWNNFGGCACKVLREGKMDY